MFLQCKFPNNYYFSVFSVFHTMRSVCDANSEITEIFFSVVPFKECSLYYYENSLIYCKLCSFFIFLFSFSKLRNAFMYSNFRPHLYTIVTYRGDKGISLQLCMKRWKFIMKRQNYVRNTKSDADLK